MLLYHLQHHLRLFLHLLDPFPELFALWFGMVYDDEFPLILGKFLET